MGQGDGGEFLDSGFIVPENAVGWDKSEDSEEYKRANGQFTRVLIEKNVQQLDVTDSAKYGYPGFSDSQFIKFYFTNTPYDKLSVAVVPFYKDKIFPKIKLAVEEYIKSNYKEDVYDSNNVVTEVRGLEDNKEQALAKGLRRYLGQMQAAEHDIARAIKKVSELPLDKMNSLFFSTSITPTPSAQTEIINQFNSQMLSNKWKTKNRADQNNYWLHFKIKEELGSKKYTSLLDSGKIKLLEKELEKGKNLNQLIQSL